MTKELQKGRLKVKISPNRTEMGAVAAKDAGDFLVDLLSKKEEVNIIFAAAPSQNDFLAALLGDERIDWTRVNAFHMDEYVGIDPTHPAGFVKFLRDRIFDMKPFKSVNCLNCQAEDPQAECERYAKLLEEHPIDTVFLGIGENGHIAFNDPHVAFFDDPKAVKVIDLAPACRQQQVNDGCFPTIDDVPQYAFTITIPELIRPRTLFCIVPTKLKAPAIAATCDGPITTECPASILRTHCNTTLYLDADSASLIKM